MTRLLAHATREVSHRRITETIGDPLDLRLHFRTIRIAVLIVRAFTRTTARPTE
jgi:hypothetical protein